MKLVGDIMVVQIASEPTQLSNVELTIKWEFCELFVDQIPSVFYI
jgi:hypothetical protein